MATPESEKRVFRNCAKEFKKNFKLIAQKICLAESIEDRTAQVESLQELTDKFIGDVHRAEVRLMKTVSRSGHGAGSGVRMPSPISAENSNGNPGNFSFLP